MEFNLQLTSHVKLDIYSITGNIIENVVDANISSGLSKIPVDVSKLQNGIYIVRLNVNNSISYQKISVMK